MSDARPVILVIDDAQDNLTLMMDVLRSQYRVKVALSGQRGLQLARAEVPPDLVLLDIMMPEMDGYEVIRQLRAEPRTSDLPVIFLTAMSADDDEQRGLDLGAVDYITKPISPPIVLARVRNHLQLKAARDFLRNQNEYLEGEVQRRTRQVTAIQDVTILALGSLAETRDNETGRHLRRTQSYVKALALELRNHPKFVDFCTPENIELLFKSAPLHDIGKVGIPDRILLKPGKLTAEEFEVMKTHTTLGRDAIARAEVDLGAEVEFLRMAKEIACGHQERWNGTGYPQGLRGVEIPISARLMAVADVYDALISPRVYKQPMTHEQAVDFIRQGRGEHFDPDIVDGFLAIQEDFRAIASRYADARS